MASTEPDDEATEARGRFEDAYELLRTGFDLTDRRDHAEMTYEELVAEHETMEALRGDAFMARRGIVSRFHPPAHAHVDVPVGVPDTSRTGRVFALIGAMLFLAIFFLAWWLIAGNRADVRLELLAEEIVEVETAEGIRCQWQLSVRVVNGTEGTLELDRAYAIVDRGRQTARVAGPDRIVADGRGRFELALSIGTLESGVCPGVDALDHGELYLEFGADPPMGTIDRSLRF